MKKSHSRPGVPTRISQPLVEIWCKFSLCLNMPYALETETPVSIMKKIMLYLKKS